MEQQPPRAGSPEPVDPLEDQLLGLGREALEAAERAGLGRLAEVLERLDPELLVEQADGLRAEARDLEQLDEARRDLRPEPLVDSAIRPVVTSSAILSLIAWPTPGDLRRVAGAVGGDEVDRAAADRVRRAVVGDRLERDLALDLEHVADLVEDPGEVAVRQVVAVLPRIIGVLIGLLVVRVVGVDRVVGGGARFGVVGHRRPMVAAMDPQARA